MAWYSQYLVMIHKPFHRIFGKNSSASSSESITPELRIIQYKEHGLIRNNISPCATKVTLDLQEAGYSAFIVGGAVRDLLLGLEPKDFDIATNATPEQIRKTFKASRIIGKRFKLVHVFNRSELLEVATFRSGSDQEDGENIVTDSTGKILRDNNWGTLEQDCHRRDFTVNALYYCPVTKKIEDQIFVINENIRPLKSELEDVLLEFNYLSSPEKLVQYQTQYFEKDLIKIEIMNIKEITENNENLEINDLISKSRNE